EFQARLRPSLRDIAAQRLATYRSIDIDAEPDDARAMLGEKVWALLEMREQDGPGIALGELQMVVDALESLDGSDDAPA
ncbi:MAG: hypothetical protein C4345_09425, partial [Chloroflexota bacterium]